VDVSLVARFFSIHPDIEVIKLQVCKRFGDPNKLMFCKRCDAARHSYCQHPPHKASIPRDLLFFFAYYAYLLPFMCLSHDVQ
jgi:hypothetical protein